MMHVAFEGTNELVLSFEAGNVKAGDLVTLCANQKVENAAAGKAPIGLALQIREGIVGVQVKGFIQMGYTGTAPSLGWQSLVADGAGGVRLAAEGESGLNCLTVQVDTTKKYVGLYL